MKKMLILPWLQNLCVTAAHCPIREILDKEKKVSLYHSFLFSLISCKESVFRVPFMTYRRESLR